MGRAVLGSQRYICLISLLPLYVQLYLYTQMECMSALLYIWIKHSIIHSWVSEWLHGYYMHCSCNYTHEWSSSFSWVYIYACAYTPCVACASTTAKPRQYHVWSSLFRLELTEDTCTHTLKTPPLLLELWCDCLPRISCMYDNIYNIMHICMYNIYAIYS